MISRLRGTLVRRDPDSIEVMTAGGVGYEVEIPLSVFEKLPRAGQDVELLTHQVVREDDVLLFGFLQPAERELFGKLLGASGVGPRLALALMSTLTPAALARAITDRDVATLVRVPGVGKKTAERIALELGDKLEGLALTAGGPSVRGAAAQEAVGALVALGHPSSSAAAAVRQVIEEDGPQDDAKALIRKALAIASR